MSGLKSWFAGYVQAFRTGARETQQNIDMKAGHTARVCREIHALGRRLGLGDEALRLAEAIALLHDVGRFEQYARYRTFRDGQSEDHAEMGLRVLERQGVLNALDRETAAVIRCAIRLHNRADLAGVEEGACLFFSRLLRDADKLDIWRMVTRYYHRGAGPRNGALELELPDTAGFSAAVLGDVLRRGNVDMRHVRNLNDYKLLQAAWIFDVNFPATLVCVKRRRTLEKIRAVLPAGEPIDGLFAVIKEFRIQAGSGT